MSRSRSRVRKRRALFEKLRADFRGKRQDPEAMEKLLRWLAQSNYCVWAVASAREDDIPLDDAERAMIAQIVAPRMACMTPGSVHRRYEESARRNGAAKSIEVEEQRGMSQVSSLTPGT